jgi:hypothetical protein
MLPSQLRKEDFAGYPPQARDLAATELPLLSSLPLAFLPLLLRELIVFDWKFPVERKELLDQLHYLHDMPAAQLQNAMAPFAALRLTPQLEAVDWVNTPGIFSEQLSAHLWASHQIDAFRTASVEYVRQLNASTQKPPLPSNRLAIVLVGSGVRESNHPLFRKLRPQGTYFRNVQPEKGFEHILQVISQRSVQHPIPFAHWYVDGDTATPPPTKGVTCVSYRSLYSVRTALLDRLYKLMQPGGGGPELARTSLAQMTLDQVGLSGNGAQAVLNRFQLSILTEGSGTQIFSTTFVQWTAREVLRRAQPLTLLARFTPRQHEQSMTKTLGRAADRPQLDALGSLIDADMGAYYTWINLQRLPGAERSSFLVWFEGKNEALAIAPSLPRNSSNSDSLTIGELISRIA